MSSHGGVSLDKCMRIMSVGVVDLAAFNKFRNWVLAHDQKGQVLTPPQPGRTGWQHQVPFWTKNARSCSARFAGYSHFVSNSDAVDNATGLKLMHGYFCCGRVANNMYSTLVEEDLEEDLKKGEYRQEISAELIDQATIGVKFYCYGAEGSVGNSEGWNPRLVVVALSLRVDQNGLVCVSITLSTNLYFIGGHGSETRADVTHRFFSQTKGWEAKRGTWNWNDFRSSRTKAEVDRENIRHAEVLEKLLEALAV